MNTKKRVKNSYYNTNNEVGLELKESNKKAKTQEDAILDIFKISIRLTASGAWLIYNFKGNTPITSIRRAITNLCNEGKLLKTPETKVGIYGKSEHVYQISSVNVDPNGQLSIC